ncbi:MAG TPA: hypothetical protein VNT60_00475, partial [Deinococcales bacterium]|nr:hypothetical protein [Deinococcales bacterium]
MIAAPATTPPLLRAAAWARHNLFSTPGNTVLTVVTVALLAVVLRAALTWAFTEAQWAVVPANFRILMAGPYPQDQHWRLWAIVAALAALSGLQWGKVGRAPRAVPALLAAVSLFALVTQRPWPSSYLLPAVSLLPAASYWLGRRAPPRGQYLLGGWVLVVAASVVLLGAGGIPTGLWGGLLLTVLLALSAIVFS